MGLLFSVEERTHQCYGASILQFTQFCDRENISENMHMLADPVLLSVFIAEHIGHTSIEAIKLWINGLCLWHLFNHVEWLGKDPWIKAFKHSATLQSIALK